VNDKIVKFEIGERVDSDHMPLSLVIEKEEEEEEEENEEKSQEVWKKVICWDEEARKLYKANTEEGEGGEKGWIQGEETIERKWEKIKETIQAALVIKEVKQRRRKIGHKDWWDKSSTKRKREVKKKYRRWKKGLGAKEDYLEEKRNLKEWLEKKKKAKKDEEEEVLRRLKNEKEVWKFINRKRIKKERRENNIPKEEWRRHFMEILGGSENRIEEERRMEEKEEGEEAGKEEKSKEGELVEEEELEEEEIVEAIRKMKIGKAAGIDGIPYEAWRYGGMTIRNGLVDLIKQVWRKNKIPEDWKSSIIVPLHKKGDIKKAENYRGISLLCTAYKIYAEVLEEQNWKRK